MRKLPCLLAPALLASLCAPAWAAGPAVPQFSGVPNSEVTPEMNFGGFFRHHQPVKVVFGVSDPGAQTKETLTNAALMIQYLKSRHERYQMQVVLYGKAVFVADQWKSEYSVYQDLMQELHAQGVEFRVCFNSMTSLHVKKDDLYPYAKVIPAGILQIVKKEMQGYQYISNR